MNRETIEKAARKLLKGIVPCEWNQQPFIDIFVDAAQWRINSVWHSPDEEPRKRDIILAEMAYEDGDTGYEVGWKAVLSDEANASMVRWAYVADLLPNSTEFDGIKKKGGEK